MQLATPAAAYMMDPAWPKRIDCGHGENVTGEWPENGPLAKQNRIGFLASSQNRQGCFGVASMPACPRTTNCSNRIRE